MTTKTAPRKRPPTKLIGDGSNLDIVAGRDIATRLGISPQTMEKWIIRAKAYAGKTDENGVDWAFPAPRWTVANGNTKLWLWDVDIMPWLVATGRDVYLKG